MFCNKCGNQVDENGNVNFCPKCGNDLSESLKEIRAKKALDMLNNYDEIMKNSAQPVHEPVEQTVTQQVASQPVVQQAIQQPVQPVNQTTQTSQTTQATNAQPKKKSNTGVIVAVCLVCAIVVFGAIGYGIKTLVGNLIGNVTSVIDEASKEIEKVEKDIDKKVKDKDKEKEDEIDVVNNKSDIALAKEESAKVFKENGKRVGSKEYGFVSVPKDWGTFYDVDGTEALQYSYGNEWIVTLFSVDASQANALTYANAVYSSFAGENVEDIDTCTVAINDYTAYQVAAYYPDEKTHLICWFIDGKENDKTYYIAVEGPDPTSEYFYNIVLTFAENE